MIKQFLNNSCRVEFDKFFPYTHKNSLHKNNVRETTWQILCLELLPHINDATEDSSLDGQAVKPTIYII